MNEPIEWRKSEEWSFAGKDFQIVIRHWTENVARGGPNRWAVYAYIYPKHPHFDTFGGDGIYQSAAEDLPLHCGASFVRHHYRAHEEIASVQVGADYNHDGDAQFGFYETSEQAVEVFTDAGRLFKCLQEMALNAEEPKIGIEAAPEIDLNQRIKTKFDPPPIPIRSHDWRAWADDEEDGPFGWGATKAEAIADLKIELEARE